MDFKFNRFSSKKWEYIIIHHSATFDGKTYDWNAINKYHVIEKGWNDIGYAFGIELIGDCYYYMIGRSLTMSGAHTLGMNDKAIGICLVGNYDLTEPKPVQYNLLADLCRALIEEYGIPMDNIKLHRDYTTLKTCPGTKFDLELLKETIIGGAV